ncbi:TonB family protein [Nostoc sp. NMS9]|uniref:TonB family protein n=1 Tax=Nostoc sp. NMS9 TaxID=2815393 RepID=UPI0025DF0DC6|nr:TonB family protein [Nostoc sp. NMS9]MBN3941661.1 TonB family protein [Nostoc sp. NMS9]
MAFSHEFQRYRSVRPFDILPGLVSSILLHSILLIGSKYWFTAFMPGPKQEIPIEVVEVYPNETHIPQKTSFRATKNSIAGGKALPKRPVSAVKSVNSDAHKASSKSPFDSTTLSSAEVFQPEPKQQKAESPNLSLQQPKVEPTAIAKATIPPAPKVQPTAIAKATIPPAPKVQPTAIKRATIPTTPKVQPTVIARATIPTTPKVQPTAIARATIPTTPKVQPTVIARATIPTTPKVQPTAIARATIPTTPKVQPTVIARATIPTTPKVQPTAIARATIPTTPKVQPTVIARATIPTTPKPKKMAVAPNTTPPPALTRKTAPAPAITSPIPNPKKLDQSRTLLSGRTPYRAQSSRKTDAASLLGGTQSVSSRNFSGDYLAALPNSNRDNQAPSGIDASSQDIDITSYLNQLQQQVKQQWLPEVSQSSRRTVLNFTINRSGQLSNLQLAQTSGFSVTDQAALNAIQRSAPFAPLPTGYTSNQLPIQFTFDINVYGQLNLSGDGG